MLAAALFAAALAVQTLNVLTPEEKRHGWILLFDGKTTNGWHTFKEKEVRPGWQIKDGVLTSVDPGNAGDLCTDRKFDWFELSLDYNLPKSQNSGIMFRVA